MKKQLLWPCLALALTGSAQSYVNNLSWNTATMDCKVMRYNTAAAAPEILGTSSNSQGFSLTRFNETNGSVSVNYNSNVVVNYRPVAFDYNGSNTMVAGYAGNNIYLHYNNSSGSSIYSLSFPRFNNDAIPVDITYNGAGYFYLLCRTTMTNHPITVLVYKIDAATGNCVSGGRTNSSNVGESYIPQDIETKSATEILVSGIYENASGTKKFFVGKITDLNGKIGVGNMEYFSYGYTNSVPAQCFMKISGNTVHYLCSATGNATENDLIIMTGGFSSAGPPWAFVSSSVKINNFDFGVISSVDLRGNYIAIGYSPLNSPTTLGGNLLYNISAQTASCMEYTYSGSRAIRTIISPATSRMFSASGRGVQTWHNIRTQVNNPEVSSNCSKGYQPQITIPQTITVSLIPNTYFNFGIAYTPTALSNFPTQIPWVRTQMCAGPIAISSGNNLTGIGDDNDTPAALKIFPNPAQDQFTIQLGEISSDNARYEIYNVTGELVLSGNIRSNSEQVEVSSLNSGIYLIRITDGENVYTERLIRN